MPFYDLQTFASSWEVKIYLRLFLAIFLSHCFVGSRHAILRETRLRKDDFESY